MNKFALRLPAFMTSLALSLSLGLTLAAMPLRVLPEDIDIYTGRSAGASARPNILFVLDNTSNWSQQSQQFPNETQGQAEVAAIKEILEDPSIEGIVNGMNMGIMAIMTEGNAQKIGGVVYADIKPMDPALDANAKADIIAMTNRIYADINGPTEKRNANVPYGWLFESINQYLAGGASYFGNAGVFPAHADSDGYTTDYTQFESPMTADNECAKTVIIFISNPNSNGPAQDDADNYARLEAEGGDATPQLQVPRMVTTTAPIKDPLGTSSCRASAGSCGGTDFSQHAQCSDGTYTSCSCDATTASPGLAACPTGTFRFDVTGTNFQPGTPTTTTTTTTTTSTSSGGSNAGCYTSQASCNGDQGGLTCPANTDTGVGSNPRVQKTYSCSYACGSATSPCSSINTSPPPTVENVTLTTGCSAYTGNHNGLVASTDANRPACPSNTDTGVGTNPRTQVTYSCAYSKDPSAVCNPPATGNDRRWNIYGSATKTTTVTSSTASNKHQVTQTITETTTTTESQTTSFNLGNTVSCFANQASCNPSDFSGQCSGYSEGCTCSSTSTSTGVCPNSGNTFTVVGNGTLTAASPALVQPFKVDPPLQQSRGATIDEWARHFFQEGVRVTYPDNSVAFRTAQTFTIDVYNKQQNADHTALMINTADAGGGEYFSARSRADITAAIKKIVIQVQAVNSAFAATSLPVNANNRTQNENQVYIGMFRPSSDATPRWYGNVKRYQIVHAQGELQLGDVNGQTATDAISGFISHCATSFWTSDSGSYWLNVLSEPRARGECTAVANWSDLPDGPFVEKGAAAEVLRKGNNPPGTNSSPTYAVNRNLKTRSGSTLVDFNAGSSGLSAELVDWLRGVDNHFIDRPFPLPDGFEDENGTGAPHTDTRASIHGDVVHSRPLPVTYADRIAINYGGNDGVFRSVDSATGRELWSFIAPEFFSDLSRLKSNSPVINYPNVDPATLPTPQRKDYFFDGTIGLYQKGSAAVIYPSLRRGGRMIYAFDVANPDAPGLQWSGGFVGCPNLNNNTGCQGGDVDDIGQTWSLPAAAFIKGYSDSTPVIVTGGGYDTCDDANKDPNASPTCQGARGSSVFVIDGLTGAVIKRFDTDYPVPADIAMTDVNTDDKVDFAFAADTGGNIWRLEFVDQNTKAALPPASWTIRRVAHTDGRGHKFLFPPAIVQASSNVTYLAIGSGDREHPLPDDYPKDITNSFYVFRNTLSSNADIDLDDPTVLSNQTTAPDLCDGARILEDPSVSGWFIDLPTGEQVVSSALIVKGQVIFNTHKAVAPAGGSCATSLGIANGYLMNLFSSEGTIAATGPRCGGDRSSRYVGPGGLVPSPVLATVPVTINGATRYVDAVFAAPDPTGGASHSQKPPDFTPEVPPIRRSVYWFKSTGDN